LPEIGRRVLAENELWPEALAAMESLIAEIPDGLIRPFTDTHAPTHQFWQTAVQPHRHQNWLEVPWFFAETYFFRRIVEAVDYFRTGYDPYHYRKQQELAYRQDQLHQLARQLAQSYRQGWQPDTFNSLLSSALWGNQADMSLWTADDPNKPDHASDEARRAHLLVNEGTAVANHLDSLHQVRVDFVCDNAGIELVGDLILADYLLTTGKADAVHLHLKLHPTFVSDATLNDVEETLAYLTTSQSSEIRAPAIRLEAERRDGRFQLHTHPFWTSPYPLWHMPDELRRLFAASHLVICKGDANYRRALGDAHWPYTTLFADIVSYFPAPIVFLRTCKSEVLAGLTAGQVEELAAIEPDWVTNGKWGVIQFVSEQATVNSKT
jgi:uncharacterized protein with ATP-grasp and redox domains